MVETNVTKNTEHESAETLADGADRHAGAAAWPGNALETMRHPREELPSDDELPQAFFSDETERFRIPAEPEAGEEVRLRLRVEHGLNVKPYLVLRELPEGASDEVGGKQRETEESAEAPTIIALEKSHEDGLFEWYETRITCPATPLAYRFVIEYDGRKIVYQKNGAGWLEESEKPNSRLDFHVVPGFHTPSWAQGAVMYQIFPDRFANGDPSNDVFDGEYAYDSAHVRHVDDWDALPVDDDYRRFYGGDLQGIAAKFDYLESLGIEAIYLNPIFISPSTHRYDTQDYDHVDPHLAVIVNDLDHPLQDGDVRNVGALSYIRRTTSSENLEASDAYFASFCEEAHRRGIRIILDGVFNHCGSFSAWMNREHVYHHDRGYELGAFESEKSPYHDFFCFSDEFASGYESWWGFPTLPKLNYEASSELRTRIIDIARKWALPPYSIDGWRLDVAADLGHSMSYNHGFWKEFRIALKEANPDLLIVAEHYGDPSPWLGGDEWDTVMNYDAFMEPVSFFFTGMEKHSDSKRAELCQDGGAFHRTMRECMAYFDWQSLLCAMNELSNHDHSRFLTRTNRMVGRIGSLGPYAASEHIDKRVFREAVVVQMTWPGAPTIYYGDEAGQVGWTDPDCRRSFPWGHEDWGLIELHRALVGLRKKHSCLRDGSFSPLGGGYGWIAFGRFDGNGRMATVCNNADHEQSIELRLRTLGAPDGVEAVQCLATTHSGFRTERRVLGMVKDGSINLQVPARTAILLEV